MLRIAVVAITWLLAASPSALAGEVEVTPSTRHSVMTLTTDESRAFEVLPGKPLRLDLVGPGSLQVLVRLNHHRRLPLLKGIFEIRRGATRIKQTELSLHRSRVGGYKEDPAILPSLPKVFRIGVPDGAQAYAFSLRAARGTTMAVAFSYDTEADQGLLRKEEEDLLALVPLVPPGGGDDDSLAPVALAPITPTPVIPREDTPQKKPAEKPTRVTPTRVIVAEPTETGKEEPGFESRPGERTTAAAQRPEIKPRPVIEPKRETALAPAERRDVLTRLVEVQPAAEQAAVVKKAPPPPAAAISVGLKGGQITPLQKVGATTPTGSLDLRYILPFISGRLTLGVEGGFYRFQVTIADEREVSLVVIPVALQLFYRFPLGTFLEPFVGLGGGAFICMGQDRRRRDGYLWKSGTSIVFGGHAAAGVETEVGPGFLLLEVRGGISFGEAAVWRNASVSGVSSLLGYRLVF